MYSAGGGGGLSAAHSSPSFGQPATAPPAGRRRGCRSLLSWRNAFWAAFLAVGLATIGVAAWGMAEVRLRCC